YSLYYATGATSRAFGRGGQPSRFTQALLRAFRGAGSDEYNGAWRVDTSALTRGIKALLDLENRLPNMPQQTARFGGNTSGILLHELTGPPEIPVLIGCDPAAETSHSKFRVSEPGGQQWTREGKTDDWQLELRVADYNLEVSHSGRVLNTSLPV